MISPTLAAQVQVGGGIGSLASPICSTSRGFYKRGCVFVLSGCTFWVPNLKLHVQTALPCFRLVLGTNQLQKQIPRSRGSRARLPRALISLKAFFWDSSLQDHLLWALKSMNNTYFGPLVSSVQGVGDGIRIRGTQNYGCYTLPKPNM